MPEPYVMPRSATTTAEVVGRFFAKVYTWMALGLALTGAVAAYVSQDTQLIQAIMTNTWAWLLIMLVTLGLVFTLSGAINRISAAAATGLFVAYAALNGILFASIFLVYTGESIAQVFFITAGTFGAMSVYGFVTKKDLSRVGQIAFMALIGLIIAMVVNIFFQSPAFNFIVSIVGVGIFVALTAYDTQKLKRMAVGMQEGTEAFQKGAIIGALALYLDFINLFLMLLRLLGNRR